MSDYQYDIKGCAKGLAWGLLLCLALTLLCGCKTKYVAVPEVHWRDSVTVRHQLDSVWRHDSVYIKEYVNGDTVYQFRDRTKTLYRDRILRDTVCVVKRDTVTKPVAVEKKTAEYKCRQRWYEAVACKIGYGVVLFLATALIVWIYRKARG